VINDAGCVSGLLNVCLPLFLQVAAEVVAGMRVVVGLRVAAVVVAAGLREAAVAVVGALREAVEVVAGASREAVEVVAVGAEAQVTARTSARSRESSR